MFFTVIQKLVVHNNLMSFQSDFHEMSMHLGTNHLKYHFQGDFGN